MNKHTIRYLTLAAAAGVMAYTLFMTVKMVKRIDDVLDETYGDEYDTDYSPYLEETHAE